MLNIAGVVILYNPDLDKIRSNLNTFVPFLKKLYIFDNSEFENKIFKLHQDWTSVEIEYHFQGNNLGLAKRLNEAVEISKNEGFDYLLTMDQDSFFEEGGMNNYMNLISSNTDNLVAQFGVNFQPNQIKIKSSPLSSLALITSGSVLNLNLVDFVGTFDENLFIDFVDSDFSFRIIERGYVNLMFTDIILNHRIGYLKNGRSIVTFKKTPRILHSPVRVYYIIRNGLYLLYKKKYRNTKMRGEIKNGLTILKNDLMYHPHLLEVYKFLFLGVKDFIFNKMGKIK